MNASASALLLCAAVAIAAFALTRRRARRRRQLLREAMHELRRPLQALALDRRPDGADPLAAQLQTALSDLEDAIDGRPARRSRDRVALGDLLDDAAGRWGRRRLPVEIERSAGSAVLEADRVRLGMALDNLIANGLEHGRGPVSVAASVSESSLRLEVRNQRRRGALPPNGSLPGPRGLNDPRRGHGLRIARREIASDEGALLPPRAAGDGRIVAAVELPRVDSVPRGRA